MPPTNVGNSNVNILIDSIIVQLFEAEHRRLKNNELGLVAAHKEATNHTSDGFLFQGQMYTDLDTKIAAKGVKTTLSPSLVPKMVAHLKDRQTISFDKQMIKQALVLVLKDCRSRQEVRDMLPNELVEMVPELSSILRIDPEGFLIRHDERKLNQYTKLRDKISFYAVARMLY